MCIDNIYDLISFFYGFKKKQTNIRDIRQNQGILAIIINMRKIVALEFISLDGVLQAPGGSEEDTSKGFTLGGWTEPLSDEFTGEEMLKQIDMPLDLLLGRKTYDIFADYWPKNKDVPVIGERFDTARKYVVSKCHQVALFLLHIHETVKLKQAHLYRLLIPN